MHFLLIHGPWHGAWQWEEVADLLADRGYSSDAPTLLGHGPGEVAEAIRMTDYVEALEAILASQRERTVLVAHSALAGPARAALASCGRRVAAAVYLNPLAAPPGRCVMDALPPGARVILESLAGGGAIPPDPDWITRAWMPGATAAQQYFVRIHLVPQPLSLLDTPLPRAARREARVPTVALVGVQDASLPRWCQEASLEALSPDRLARVSGGHDAPITHAEELARALVGIARVRTRR